MDFTKAIAIFISGVLALSMIDTLMGVCSRRTHIMAYAGGHFEIFETLSFVRFVLQLPASVQDRLRHWLDEHLHTVQQRE
jgi:hypothetical protein